MSLMVSIPSYLQEEAPPACPEGPVQGLPEELLLSMFAHLSYKELAKTSLICKKWNRIGDDAHLWNSFQVEKLFPIKIFDEKAWKAYAPLEKLGLSVDDIEPMNSRSAISEVARFVFRMRKEGVSAEEEGMTLLTIPKNLTLKKLLKVAEAPLKGKSIHFRKMWFRILQVLGEMKVGRTYRLIITNSVLNTSRGMSFKNQQALVQSIGCEIPKFLEAMALAAVNYISSPLEFPLRLFKDAPRTYTRCIERVDGDRVAFGSFNVRGFCGMSSFFDSVIFGVAALKRLKD